MSVLDVGCGMGFFSLPLAKMVGEGGRVYCIDLQEKMIKGLIRRARKVGLARRIEARTCRPNSLDANDLAGRIDFALAFASAHEVPDKERLFSEIYKTLKQSGKLLLVEPKGHVSKNEFDETASITQRAGFQPLDRPDIRRSYAILFVTRQDRE